MRDASRKTTGSTGPAYTDPDAARIQRLERQLRWTQGAALAAVLGLWVLLGTGGARPDAGPSRSAAPLAVHDTIRTRALEIIGAQGRARVVLAAPLPDPSPSVQRMAPMTGMAIFDPSGHERFGVGLQPGGRMAMGFDAPPGVGTGRNPERINLVANSDGTAFLRLLGQDSYLKSLYRLNAEGEAELQFVEVTPDSVLRRRYGFDGTDMLRQAR